jgi:hypothetical protein
MVTSERGGCPAALAPELFTTGHLSILARSLSFDLEMLSGYP